MTAPQDIAITPDCAAVSGLVHRLVLPGCVLYRADCREVLGEVKADAIITDPPYGISFAAQPTTGGRKRGQQKETWDDEAPADVVLALREMASRCVIWGGNYYALPPSKCWLVWDKENGDNGYADCELAWTNLDKAVRMVRHQWHGMLRKGKEERWHPTQKPLDVMAWALRHAPADVQTVLDPWMGSGTTLRAAKDHGKQAIGIEREERYCEIAAQRLAQEALPFDCDNAKADPRHD